ncbi:MAG TPA: hypothetical protein VF082_05650 [Jiangellaceae bacterium]
MPTTGRAPASGWVGWIWFAGLVLVLVGTLNAIEGLAAIVEDDVLVQTGQGGLLVFDLTTWGWVHLLFGALQILTGLALFSGAAWARISAIVLVMLSVIAQVAWLNANPAWSVIVIALDLVVLWALVVHGDEAREGMA